MFRKLFYPTLLLGVLAAAQVRAADVNWIRAAYWDSRFPTGWVDNSASIAVRDGLQAAGYEILDADQLKTWMSARIADKKYSVVVFCRDIAPDTVVETMSASCTLRKYLDAGGKIVFFADIPFYNQAHADGTNTNWADAGATGILGFNTSSAPRDSGSTATITAAGTRWGLTSTWTSQRPLAPSVTSNVTILATDNAGNAAAWVKHYVANDKFRGFVRLRDTGGQPNIQDVIRAAEYVGVTAVSPDPADGATGVTVGLFQWTAGSFAVRHNVYIGTTPDLTEANLVANRHPQVAFYYPVLEAGIVYYWRIDEVEGDGTIHTGDVWSFMTAPVKAFAPSPRNGNKWIDVNADLSWMPGQDAASHDVYFSTDEDAVATRSEAAFKINQYGATFDPGLLAEETTFFWAVDEVASDGINPGDVWRFTTGGNGGGVKGEYFAGMVPAGTPALVRTDESVNFTWGDGNGPGEPLGVDQFSARWTADLEVAIADTYTFITSSDDGAALWLNDEQIISQWVDQGTTDAFSEPIYLEPGIYSLRMEYYENGGGAVAQLSWQTPEMAREIIPPGPLQPPVRARAPYPANGDANIPQDVTLQWTPGDSADRHQVYFGEDAEAVANATPDTAGIYQGEQALADTLFIPGQLEWNKTYYWKVNEVNSLEADSPWEGSVWSFTTADFVVVDDFENYNDSDYRIFDIWLDDYSLDRKGSIVGKLDAVGGTFGELTIVHSGKQSMPYDYNNVETPFYSEAVREFDSLQDWTVNGVSDLTLWFRGSPAKFLETAPGQYTISSNTADIWGTADNFRYVYKTLNGDGTISAKVLGITGGSAAWAKAGVMIRESLDPSSSYALMHPTPDGKRAFQSRPSIAANAISVHSNAAAVTFPVWVKVERKGNEFTAYYSQDGKTWTVQPGDENVDGGSTNPQTIMMGSSVCIGMAVSGNNAAAGFCFAEFADVVTTGGATGAWKVVNVGPNPGNDPAPLYVTVTDSSNKSATVVNPDPGAVNVADWTEWKIPLTSFTGVSRSKIKKMVIGVGDPANPTVGNGSLFFDDIRVTKP